MAGTDSRERAPLARATAPYLAFPSVVTGQKQRPSTDGCLDGQKPGLPDFYVQSQFLKDDNQFKKKSKQKRNGNTEPPTNQPTKTPQQAACGPQATKLQTSGLNSSNEPHHDKPVILSVCPQNCRVWFLSLSKFLVKISTLTVG